MLLVAVTWGYLTLNQDDLASIRRFAAAAMREPLPSETISDSFRSLTDELSRAKSEATVTLKQLASRARAEFEELRHNLTTKI